MKIYTGTDIIEIERIQQSIDELRDSFKNKIYTKKEIEYCESKKKMKYQHYAARFAAKEAVFKSVSKLIENKYDIDWQDIEILNEESGRPQVELKKDTLKKQIESIDISISHCKEYAIASVVIMIKE